jgi:hypothetical protein
VSAGKPSPKSVLRWLRESETFKIRERILHCQPEVGGSSTFGEIKIKKHLRFAGHHRASEMIGYIDLDVIYAELWHV